MKKKKEYLIPTYIGKYVYIKPRQVTVLNAFDTTRNFRSVAFEDNKKNLKDNKHNGELSKKSARKLSTVVDWLLASAKDKLVYDKSTKKHFKFKVNFITLTMPDTDKPVHEKFLKSRLLQPFLSYMRQYGYMRNYVWKMEFHKSGKIHLHLTTDTFVHYHKLRDVWNRILKKNGVLDKWVREQGNECPNSTDVHSVYKVKNVAAYIAKYMAKTSNDNHKAACRIWGCNYELTRALKTSAHVFPPDEFTELSGLMNPKIDFKQLVKEVDVLGQIKTYGEVFFLRPNQWELLGKSSIREAFNEARSKIRNLAPDIPKEVLVIESKKISLNQKSYKQAKIEFPLLQV